MKLITELIDAPIQTVLEEDSTGKKKLFIEGVFMVAGVKNKNGRIYPNSVMENEVKRYIKEKVETNQALGELNHPSNPQINLDRASHLIKSLKIEGNNVIGRALVVDTPMGNIARGLLEAGANLGISSRGLGSLKPLSDGIMEVQDDFKIVTAGDLVSDPSAPGAYIKGIMENVEFFYGKDGSIQCEAANNIKKTVHKMSKKTLEESAYRLMKAYLSVISKQ